MRLEEEEGDGEGRGGGERERPRRTWAESVATPAGHQGRKMWVASLIEAPIIPAVGDHLNNVSTSPSSTDMEEHRLVPGASTRASVTLCDERNTAEEFPKELTPGLSSTMEQLPPSESRQEGGMHPRQTASMEPRQEAHVTPAKAFERPSIAQDIIYARQLVSPEQLERIRLQERATCTTPREDSSRGRDPPSTAQDIIYARGTTAELVEDAMSPRLVSTRGHAPPSTAQDIMYAQGEGSTMKQSTRGQEPPSVVQDIVYGRSPAPVGVTSTRGKPPPASIQRLLYPLKDTEGKEEEGRSVRVPQRVEGEEEESFTTFQPYQDSYPMLSELPIQCLLCTLNPEHLLCC